MGSVLGFPGIDPMDAVVGARIRRWRDHRGVAACAASRRAASI